MHTRSRSPIESNDHTPSVRGSRRPNDKRVDRGRDYDKYRESGYSSSVKDGRDRVPRRNDDMSPNRREYTERQRERERQRDRERYDRRDRDRVNDTSSRARRSASPRSRHSRARERSRSGSPEPKLPEVNKKPNFKPSGLLAAETNTVKAADGTSTVLKYNEPPEARKPVEGWRLYVFKDSEQVGESVVFPLNKLFCAEKISQDLLHIQRQSAYLVGRDKLVADIALDHPSCSKQHAALQCMYVLLGLSEIFLTPFQSDRYVQEKDEYGSSKGVVK